MRKWAKVSFLLFLWFVACNGQTPQVKPPSATPTITTVAHPTVTARKLSQSEIIQAIKQEDYEKLCDGKDLHPTISQSPDGKWAAVPCNGFTKIFRIDGTLSRVFSVDDLPLPKDPHIRNSDLFTRGWTPDGKHLYLTLFGCCMDGPGGITHYNHAFYRLDLDSGQLATILEPSTGFYALDLSYNLNYLVYSKPGVGSMVFLKDMVLRTELSIPVDRDYRKIGKFIWQPDDQTVFFAGEVDGWHDGLNGFSLLSLDLKSKVIAVLLDNDLGLFLPSQWLGPNELLLWSGSAKDLDHLYWSFNVLTKDMVPTAEPKQ